MNKTAISLALAGMAAMPAIGQAREINLSTTLKDYRGNEAYLVIYVTDAQGAYQRTLWVAGKKAKYYKHLRDWAQGGGHHHLAAQVLQDQIEHLDADRFGHLGEVLAGDLLPFAEVLDQEATTAGVATEVVAEAAGQALIPRGVHLDVLVKQGANLSLSIRSVAVHGQCLCCALSTTLPPRGGPFPAFPGVLGLKP